MAALATKFGPQPFTDPQPPQFYRCGCCGCFHPVNWDGDCRDDANRFAPDQLDEKYDGDWEEVDMYDDWREDDIYEGEEESE